MTLRRELQLMRVYAVVSGSALVVLATAAFQGSPSRSQGEITVERINVVEKDGRTRMVIANSERQADTVINGHTIGAGRPRPAGMIFFNDNGDEDGGLVFDGQRKDGRVEASGSLTFDQYQQDQTIGLEYSEEGGQRIAGLNVWDRSELPLDQFMAQMDAAEKLPTEAERRAALDAIRAANGGRNGEIKTTKNALGKVQETPPFCLRSFVSLC